MTGTADPVAAWITKARERNTQWVTKMALTEASVANSPFGDLRHALGALEAVREAHSPLPASPGRCRECEGLFPCWTRRAIACELLTGEGSDGTAG